MKITDIKMRLVDRDDLRLKAVASITVDDCIAIHDIKLIQREDSIIIAMPSKKTPNGEYRDIIHPINSATRDMLCEKLTAAYREALAQNK